MSDLMVSEIFGPTVQGEGPFVGHPCTFVRLMGCNLACVWCDTPYTWDGTRFDLKAESRRMSVIDVADKVRSLGQLMVVISGGEPMLQQKRLIALQSALNGPYALHIETAGTIEPDSDLHASYVVSLKLAHSGNGKQRIVPSAIQALRDSGRVIAWKFVVQSVDDFAEIDALVDEFGLRGIWVMPEGVEPEIIAARYPELIPAAIERGYRITPRLHVDAWGNQRGH